jgi:hypothetical protein
MAGKASLSKDRLLKQAYSGFAGKGAAQNRLYAYKRRNVWQSLTKSLKFCTKSRQNSIKVGVWQPTRLGFAN